MFEPAVYRYQPALCIFRRLGDNIDDPVHCVRAPQRSARPANNLDAINIFKNEIDRIPVDPGKEWRVHAASIDKNEQLRRELAALATDSDGPRVRVDLRHIYFRNYAQQVGNGSGR